MPIGSAVVLAPWAQSEVQITFSGVRTEVSPFDYDGTPDYGFGMVNHWFFLANAGPRDAYVIVYLNVNGQVLDRTRPVSVPAGQTVPDSESTGTSLCGSLTPAVAIHTVSPVAGLGRGLPGQVLSPRREHAVPMAPMENSRPRRTHPAVVVGGITIGILALFSLQFLIPYLIGPWGLVVVAVLDLALYLEMRRRSKLRRMQRKPSRIVWGPVDRRYVANKKKSPLETEVAATFAFVTFLVVLYIVGAAVRVEYWAFDPSTNLFIVGSIMTTISVTLSWFYWKSSGGALVVDLRTQSEVYDTTDDH